MTRTGSVAKPRIVSLLDLLKPKSPLEKARKQVREAYAQPEYRREAMDKLLEIGSEEAITALLGRFTVNASGQIADEDEKRDLVEMLVDAKDKTLEPLKTFIRTQKKFLAFPIRAYVRMVDRAEARAFLRETLAQYEPLDHRSTHAKAILLTSLADLGGEETAETIAPYVADHDDDVQYVAVESLERLGNRQLASQLTDVCTSDDHSARVKRRAADALCKLGWSVKPAYSRFDAELKSAYILGKKGQLIPKHRPEA